MRHPGIRLEAAAVVAHQDYTKIPLLRQVQVKTIPLAARKHRTTALAAPLHPVLLMGYPQLRVALTSIKLWMI
jgi:hypothetical protein